MMAARLLPAASITARTSSMRVSSDGTSFTMSDMPVPRLSNVISRPMLPRRSFRRRRPGTSQVISTCEAAPGTNTMSNGPSPDTW